MRTFQKTAISIASAALLIGGLAACSSTASTSGDSASTPSANTSPTPIAQIDSLAGVDTQVTLDPGFLAALTSLKLTPGVIGTATLTDGALHFPITGGNVKYFDPKQSYRPYVQGEIDHNGSGISLTAGKTTVQLTNFVIDPGTSKLMGTVSANGVKVADNVYIFSLHGQTLKPLYKDADGNAVLEGTEVYVSADAAALLDKTFGTTAVTDKLLVGVAKITVK
ncbi:hypothetical protein [Galbitalea soli]|uniref:Lipoprotein n=1 Tax=Galbitalea soli TaxID=1268042 RepID=A0A7C9PM78_9MICO|nr:hypothetical protein [Galbitalea soli]NEM90770.1 hypothetical protein [Galbitalea soli]NYJ31488.1 hypothetical protein [Galbitalea soli]